MSEKKKGTRFTDEMNKVLIEEYTANQSVLKSKFSNVITNEKKKQTWESITSAVNAVNAGERKSVEQVKKRWEDMTSAVKKKERSARQNEIKRLKYTGNGNLPDDEEGSDFLKCSIPIVSNMTSPERKVAGILGPAVFSGISSGLDTLQFVNDNTAESLSALKSAPANEVNLELGENSSILHDDQAEFNFAAVVASCSSHQDVVEVPVPVAPVSKRRKRSLTEVQQEYFEVAAEYFKLKMRKVNLEINTLESYRYLESPKEE